MDDFKFKLSPDHSARPDSTQLVKLSPIGSCDHNARLNSTGPVVTSSAILNIGCVSRVITSPDAM